MIYYVTPLLHIDTVNGTMSSEVAYHTMLNGEVATVGTIDMAFKTLRMFGFEPDAALSRLSFATTGQF